MKYLIFSDTHLTDKFDEKKYLFLKKIVSVADEVIINGDFWDGYEVSFEKFIHSGWKKLFPLFKKKNTVYIYGNHDQKKFSDKRVNLFSKKQADRYLLKINKYTFIIEHGNKIFPFYDETTTIKAAYLIELFFNILEKILIKTTGKFFFIFPLGVKLNREMKRRFQKKFKNGEVLICGHTHSPEFNLKERFINTGFIIHGLAHYLIIDDQKLEFKEELYNNIS